MKYKGNAKVIPANPEAIFIPFQSRWITDDSRLKLMEKSRQIGLSWSTAYAAVERTAAAGARYDQWVSSRDDLQAKLFIEDCKMWAKIMNLAAKDLGEVVVDEKSKVSAYVLEFASGRRIHSMSSNPDAQAGKRGGRILDEFALNKDNRQLWAIAYPGITWGGSMELVSTHRGSNNFFNQLVREIKENGNPKNISLHTVTLQNALDVAGVQHIAEQLDHPQHGEVFLAADIDAAEQPAALDLLPVGIAGVFGRGNQVVFQEGDIVVGRVAHVLLLERLFVRTAGAHVVEVSGLIHVLAVVIGG